MGPDNPEISEIYPNERINPNEDPWLLFDLIHESRQRSTEGPLEVREDC